MGEEVRGVLYLRGAYYQNKRRRSERYIQQSTGWGGATQHVNQHGWMDWVATSLFSLSICAHIISLRHTISSLLPLCLAISIMPLDLPLSNLHRLSSKSTAEWHIHSIPLLHNTKYHPSMQQNKHKIWYTGHRPTIYLSLSLPLSHYLSPIYYPLNSTICTYHKVLCSVAYKSVLINISNEIQSPWNNELSDGCIGLK